MDQQIHNNEITEKAKNVIYETPTLSKEIYFLIGLK